MSVWVQLPMTDIQIGDMIQLPSPPLVYSTVPDEEAAQAYTLHGITPMESSLRSTTGKRHVSVLLQTCDGEWRADIVNEKQYVWTRRVVAEGDPP
jgi:hypothetical protein